MLSREAKELCLESWAFAANALFQRALISIEAKYSVCPEESGETQKQFIIATSQPLKDNVGETVPSASTSECFVPALCECSDAGLIPG